MNKKLLGAACALFLSTAAVFATYSESSSRSTVYPGTFNFKATVSNGNVSMSWNKFTVPSGKSFAYYKVIRSQEKSNPLYPEDGYIKYDSNLDFTSYTDEDTKAGTNYYRVCAILEGQKRYCSNVVKIDIVETYSNTSDEKEINEPKKEETKKTTTTLTELSETAKASIDAIANEFLAKVTAKFGNDTSKKNALLNTVIAQLDTLAKRNVSLKATVKYLNSKLQAQIDTLQDIKDILKVE